MLNPLLGDSLGMRVLVLFALATFLFVAGTLPLTGCGESTCDGFERSSSDYAPSITQMRLVNQLEGDPWTSVFGVGFSDSDGDLGVGTGHAEFFLNGKSTVKVPLPEFFQGGALEGNAKSGELAVPLRFSENVEDQATATLGLQPVDDDGNRSNCYSLDLEFAVSPLNR